MEMQKLGLFLLFVLSVLITNAQTSAEIPRHSFSLGPMAGYNVKNKGFAYGGSAMYEFRPFKRFGFTAALTFDQTRVDVSDINYNPAASKEVFGNEWIENVYSLNVGPRFYLGDFYLGAALGIGYTKGYTTLSDGSTLNNGHAYGLYKNFGAGYQIKLRNRDVIEAEAAVFGTHATKIGGAIRYKFGR